jgi:hypothetical protein
MSNTESQPVRFSCVDDPFNVRIDINCPFPKQAIDP